MHRLAAIIAAALALAATQPARAAVDLTPGGRFDPVGDRDTVVFCLAADMAVSQIGDEILGLSDEVWQAADEPVGERFQHMQVFATQLRDQTGESEESVSADVAAAMDTYIDGFTSRATPTNQAELFAEAVDNTVRCDAVAKAWTGA